MCVNLTLARALSLSRYTVAVFVHRALWSQLVLQTGACRQLIMLYLFLCQTSTWSFSWSISAYSAVSCRAIRARTRAILQWRELEAAQLQQLSHLRKNMESCRSAIQRARQRTRAARGGGAAEAGIYTYVCICTHTHTHTHTHIHVSVASTSCMYISTYMTSIHTCIYT